MRKEANALVAGSEKGQTSSMKLVGTLKAEPLCTFHKLGFNPSNRLQPIPRLRNGPIENSPCVYRWALYLSSRYISS